MSLLAQRFQQEQQGMRGYSELEESGVFPLVKINETGKWF